MSPEAKEEVKQEIKKNVKEQAAKIIAEGEKQATAVKASTRKNCASAKTQAYANADKVLKDAKGPLQKAAAKITVKELKKAADKAEVKCIAEGDKKADKILDAAKAKAAAL